MHIAQIIMILGLRLCGKKKQKRSKKSDEKVKKLV